MAPQRTPTASDFPRHLTLTITPPPDSPRAASPSPNILLLLHGLGDTAASFASFARALQLPETTILTLQAPTPLPFDLGGFHWGDDVAFDTSRSGGEPALDMDAGFSRSTHAIVEEVVRGVLCTKCGYDVREVIILGFGQGGMAGLVAAREVQTQATACSSSGSSTSAGRAAGDRDTWSLQSGALAGVISIGAPYPLSGSRVDGARRAKNRTPVLVVAGRDSQSVTDGAVKRTKDVFEFVEVHRYAKKGDGMPRNREEMMPVMRFFASRLRSRQGVPEGSIEITLNPACDTHP